MTMGDFKREHHFTETAVDPPCPPKTSQWEHKREDAPPPSDADGEWVYDTISNVPPIGNAPIVGRVGYWRPTGKRSLAEMRQVGNRYGARWRRLCTPTRVRFDQELGIEVEV